MAAQSQQCKSNSITDMIIQLIAGKGSQNRRDASYARHNVGNIVTPSRDTDPIETRDIFKPQDSIRNQWNQPQQNQLAAQHSAAPPVNKDVALLDCILNTCTCNGACWNKLHELDTSKTRKLQPQPQPNRQARAFIQRQRLECQRHRQGARPIRFAPLITKIHSSDEAAIIDDDDVDCGENPLNLIWLADRSQPIPIPPPNNERYIHMPNFNLTEYRLEVFLKHLLLRLATHLPKPPLKPPTTSSANKTSPKPPPAFHLVAGAASGFTSSILLQPADLLKTRVQQSGSHSLIGTIRSIASTPQPLKQLWRGTLPSTIRTSLGSALYFTTLNALRTRVAKSSALTLPPPPSIQPGHGPRPAAAAAGATSSNLVQLSPAGNLACGAFARASVGFIMMPITVIKVRYESNYYNYRSLFGAARDIWRGEGLKGLFAGFGATALRDTPYAGLYVVFYEQGKKVLGSLIGRLAAPAQADAADPAAPPRHLTPSLSALTNFASSTVAAASATLLTNPPDAIKTRLQLQPQKYRNLVQALKLMLKEDGVGSLFDGLVLRMARKAMSSALAWTVYEEVVRRAEARWVLMADDD